MDSVNKTLYIPLYGKAYVSEKGILLKDPMAERIWHSVKFLLKGKAKSRWLAYYMGMRSAVFDRWLIRKMEEMPDAVILHLGCGLDSRAERVGLRGHCWYDLDFPQVIEERKKFYRENADYHMIASDVRQNSWLQQIDREKQAIVVMEGLSMYLTITELNAVLTELNAHFSQVSLLMDCYTEFAAKASKYKNPINEVGVHDVTGIDTPELLALSFVQEHEMTPKSLIDELRGMEKTFFQWVFAGSLARKIYRLYEFSSH